jgi:hypothetical protein
MLQLDHRVFRFSISCKTLGFFIYRPHFYECGDFKVLLRMVVLIRNLRFGLSIEEVSWSNVHSKNRWCPSFADVDKIPPVSGANAIPVQKLVFDWIFSRKSWSLII